MTTTVTINFTADAGGVALDGSKFYGPPAEIAKADFLTQNPVAWTAAQEFLSLGTTSGVITISAV